MALRDGPQFLVLIVLFVFSLVLRVNKDVFETTLVICSSYKQLYTWDYSSGCGLAIGY